MKVAVEDLATGGHSCWDLVPSSYSGVPRGLPLNITMDSGHQLTYAEIFYPLQWLQTKFGYASSNRLMDGKPYVECMSGGLKLQTRDAEAHPNDSGNGGRLHNQTVGTWYLG